ncbi:rubredoxin-like domain-containing protein [Desulfobacula toluolica]|uniref:Rubredoxin-type Fe(Cys)4 protein n=1 Tax=Desulfobacula toluolica (strain DSM 7467 / Tol2) TaxID=651182 RepID=K0NJ44_DESTT|nr:DUF2231 domain-containing protein [Desulfobacula toluolica]CCK79893.1 rubredoxin-type Fe(Cys)4 protein [Desulfobacula toluolica Tol2]
MKVWQCSVCKYIHRGDTPPEKCPICGVDASKFVQIDEASIPQKIPQKKTVKEPFKETGPKTPVTKKDQAPPPEKWFEKIIFLLVKHHAHPISVHAPNGILPAAVILWLLAWFFSFELFAKTAFINIVFVVLALPLVIFTGILEWKKKYKGAMTSIFKLKILAATVTTISCTISLVWYLLDPNILSSPKAWVFIFINIIMLAAVGIAGHIGGKLVFKD